MSLVAGGGVVVASTGVAVSDGERCIFLAALGKIPRSDRDPVRVRVSGTPCHTPAVGDCQGMQ